MKKGRRRRKREEDEDEEDKYIAIDNKRERE